MADIRNAQGHLLDCLNRHSEHLTCTRCGKGAGDDPVDWDDLEHWGGNIHVGTTIDDAHTASEKRAEDSRG